MLQATSIESVAVSRLIGDWRVQNVALDRIRASLEASNYFPKNVYCGMFSWDEFLKNFTFCTVAIPARKCLRTRADTERALPVGNRTVNENKLKTESIFGVVVPHVCL